MGSSIGWWASRAENMATKAPIRKLSRPVTARRRSLFGNTCRFAPNATGFQSMPLLHRCLWCVSWFVILSAPGALPAQPKPAEPGTRGSPRIMQGPMIGATSPNEILLWARLTGPFTLSVSYGETTDDADLRESDVVTARADD